MNPPNESIAFLSPYLGRYQTNQNDERTEQKIITKKRQNQISVLKSRACADVIQLCPRSILVPRGCDPFGQRHGSRPLANTAVKYVRMPVVKHFWSRDVELDQSISTNAMELL